MLTFYTTDGFLLVHESQCLWKQSHGAAKTGSRDIVRWRVDRSD